MQLEYINKTDLIVSKNNPRIHNENQIELIEKSIDEFGFINPIVIDENNRVLAGHGRLMAVGSDIDIPCVRVTNLTEEQKNAYMVLDNKSYEAGDWDLDLLNTLKEESELLEDILGFDIDNQEIEDQWTEALGYENEKQINSKIDIIVHFKNENDRKEFAKLIEQKITEKTKYIWFPKVENENQGIIG